MVSFNIHLFFLISIYSFGGRPYAEEVDCNPKVGSIHISHPSRCRLLSSEGSAPVGLTLTFGPPEVSYPGPRGSQDTFDDSAKIVQ
jgi:hypothetical protein